MNLTVQEKSLSDRLKGDNSLFSTQKIRIKNWQGGTLELEKNELTDFNEHIQKTEKL